MSDARTGRTAEVQVVTLAGRTVEEGYDRVVTEEPLEIRLQAGASTQTLAVTMRTPGNDFELAAGFLIGEGVVRERGEIAEIAYCLDPQLDAEQRYNVVTVTLARGSLPELARFERHFITSSACGVCGRAQLEALRDLGIDPLPEEGPRIAADVLYALPERMRESQKVFAATGGLHAAGLFDLDGTPLAVREDVGRHNAVDKLVGWAVTNGQFPLVNAALCVSGRASYEILQKSAVARIPIVVSVSAPSSLAVELAREFNITLASFVRGERANLYSCAWRVTAPANVPHT